MDKAIEFVDFIFDRFAFLGLNDNAAQDDIDAKIKDLRAKNHPDRLTQLDEQLQMAAKKKWELIDKCADVLQNPDLLDPYKAKLKGFKDEEKPVYSHDYPEHIFFLNTDRIDVSFLESGSDLVLNELTDKAKLITRHDDTAFERAKRLYEKMPDDPDFVGVYKDALQRKVSYLEILEKYLWAAAGVHGKKYTESDKFMMDSRLIGEAVTGHIEYIADEVIPQQFVERQSLALLGHDKNPVLLLTHDAQNNIDPASIEGFQERVGQIQDRFKALSEAIKANAESRAESVEALLGLSPFEILQSVDTNNVTIHLLSNQGDEDDIKTARVVLTMVVTEKGDQALDSDLIHDHDDKSLEELKVGEKIGTVAVVLFDRHLNQPTLSFGHAHRLIFKSFGKDIELDRHFTDDNEAPTEPTRPDASTPEIEQADIAKL